LLLDNGNTVLENNKRFLSANFKDLGREIGTQQNQAPEISQEKLREVLSSIGNDESENTRTFYAKECKNFFILMYYGAFRVSELLDIRIENIEAVSNAHFTGAVIKLDGSKTNQTKEYEAKSIPITDTEFCPYKALFAQIGNRKSGYLFGGEEKYYEVLVNRRIKKYFGEEYTSHSFRVSFVTHSKEAGASDFEIQKQTGHKTVAMIARYTRKTDVHINNSVNKLKL
jgi:integrase